MFDRYLLTAAIRRKGFTQGEIAEKIGINPATMSKKMRTGKFRADEMYKIVKVLGIEHPETIFFAHEVEPNYTEDT